MNLDENINFIELYNKTGIKFTTCAFNIDTIKLEYFNYILTPKVKIIDAIMASSALPVLFPAYKIGNSNYYDGGICNNCPTNLVGKESSIAFNIASNYKPSKYNLISLLTSLTRHINKTNNINKKIMFNISSGKYDNEVYNIYQSNDTILNIYMDGYTNTQKILYFFLKN